jgi:hypothetical protein
VRLALSVLYKIVQNIATFNTNLLDSCCLAGYLLDTINLSESLIYIVLVEILHSIQLFKEIKKDKQVDLCLDYSNKQ